MSSTYATRRSFDIGRVLQRIFGSLGRNLVVFGSPVLLVWIGFSLLQLVLRAGLGGYTAPVAGSPRPALAVLGLVSLLFLLFEIAFTYALVVDGVVADINGKTASFADSLSAGLRSLLPVAAILLIVTIAILIGSMLLVIPGLILMVIWSVVVPAAVVERRGVFGAFSRSMELINGNGWPVFALLIIVRLINLAMVFAAFLLLGLMGLAMVGAGAATPASADHLPTGLIVASVISALLISGCFAAYIMFNAAVTAALYAELKEIRDGFAPADPAAVFD